MDPKSGYSMDSGIYYSKRKPIALPTQHWDVTSFIFSQQQQQHGQQLALVDSSSGLSLTFPALRHNVRAIAAGLHGLGIRRRDVVLVLSPNSIAVPCIHLAVLSMGAILTTANPFCTENEIKKQAQDSGSVIIFAPENLIKKARATQLPVILIEGNPNAEGCISSLSLLLQSAINGFPSVDIKQEDTATLLYSSGTTGKSKGVISTHGSLIAGILSRDDMGAGDNIYLCTVPLFHVLGFFFVITCIATGNTMVVMPKFDLAEMLSNIQRYKVNSLPVSPPILVALSKSPFVSQYDLSSLQSIESGGAPLGRDIIDNFTALCPNVQVYLVIFKPN